LCKIAQGFSYHKTMNTTGLPELWHVTLAILSRQAPFVQIMLVTLAALFVVMALEGVRSSVRAIWRAHRTPKLPAVSQLNTPVALAAPPAFGPRMRSFVGKPPVKRASRPKVLDQPPRQFRSTRPVIRRQRTDLASTSFG